MNVCYYDVRIVTKGRSFRVIVPIIMKYKTARNRNLLTAFTAINVEGIQVLINART